MNEQDSETKRNKRIIKTHEAFLADLLLEDMSLVERVEADQLLEDGVASTREIYEALGLEVG